MKDKNPATKSNRPKGERSSVSKSGKKRPDRVKEDSRLSVEKPPKPQK